MPRVSVWVARSTACSSLVNLQVQVDGRRRWRLDPSGDVARFGLGDDAAGWHRSDAMTAYFGSSPISAEARSSCWTPPPGRSWMRVKYDPWGQVLSGNEPRLPPHRFRRWGRGIPTRASSCSARATTTRPSDAGPHPTRYGLPAATRTYTAMSDPTRSIGPTRPDWVIARGAGPLDGCDPERWSSQRCPTPSRLFRNPRNHHRRPSHHSPRNHHRPHSPRPVSRGPIPTAS